jgi:hypothetical protein
MTAARACLLLLLACLLRLWVMPLGSSFWVDEAGTVFVVEKGAGHPSFAAAPQVPQSIYYALPRVSHALFGSSEIAWRLPSLLVMLTTLPLIGWLAARLIQPGAGWLAIFACLALRGFDYQAADARPYGLGMLAACAAVFFLVRWLDRARPLDAALFVVSAALLLRVQLVFWPFYFVFAIYAAVRARSVGWTRIAAVFAALALALAPVVPRALALYREAGAHVAAAPPGGRELLAAFKFGVILECGAAALLASLWWKKRFALQQPWSGAPASLLLILSWWLAQPLLLFAFSHATGNSVFLPRYLWLAEPGAALLAAAAAACFLPAKRLTSLAMIIGVGALLLNGQWERLWPRHDNSDWRSAAEAITRTATVTTPVICPSPFIEARPPVWSPGYVLPGFLYSHLYAYPIAGRIYVFPFEYSPQAGEYAERLVRELFPAAGRFIVYGGAGQAGFWRDWFARRPELSGWQIRRLGNFGDVEAILFTEATRSGVRGAVVQCNAARRSSLASSASRAWLPACDERTSSARPARTPKPGCPSGCRTGWFERAPA